MDLAILVLESTSRRCAPNASTLFWMRRAISHLSLMTRVDDPGATPCRPCTVPCRRRVRRLDAAVARLDGLSSGAGDVQAVLGLERGLVLRDPLVDPGAQRRIVG